MANEDSSSESKHAGIPEAEFVEDLDSFMKRSENTSAEVVLKKMEEQHQKYKFLEVNIQTKKRKLILQMPDIEKTLKVVSYMKCKRESTENFTTNFLLSDNVYATAKIPSTDKVYLWLGANVMLEYPIDDAEKLLTQNLESARQNLENIQEDLDFLRDQYTTTEVNMARIYNWDVQQRKKKAT